MYHPSFNGEMQSSRHRPIEIMPHSQQDRQQPPPYSDPSPVNPMLTSKPKSRANLQNNQNHGCCSRIGDLHDLGL